MAGIRKHGAHRINLTLPAAAAGTGADVFGGVWGYDAFPYGIYDSTQEAIYEMTLSFAATLTGQATNFASFVIQQVRAGATLNDIRIAYNAAGVTTAAGRSINLAVAGGAVVPGAGTGTLTVQTGAALPWTLAGGDMISIQRISSNATGQATPLTGLVFVVQALGT